MVTAKKTLVLVFPMVTISTSPPLGIAMLKGYLERQLPDWDIKLLDLNLGFLNKTFAGIEAGTVKLSDQVRKEVGATHAQLVETAKVMRGRGNDLMFTQPNVYEHAGHIFSNFCKVATAMFTAECAEYERTGVFPQVLQECAAEITALKPDCVGISMIFSEQLPMGAALGRYLRENCKLPVLMGGSCLIEGAEHFMKWYPRAADVVVVGDGEDALKRLLQNDLNPKGIPGTVYREGDGVVKEMPVFEKDVDQYGTPNFDGLDLNAYFSPEPVIPLLLSRGCYWRKCTFCVHYFSAGDTYRVRSLDSIIEALRYFVDRGIRNFSFVDEMIAPGQFIRLAEAIKAANLDITYYAYSKPNKTFTPNVLKTIAESGCKFLLWGVESGNQRVLNLMGKGTVVEDIAQVLKTAHEYGIENHLFIISGFPTETHEEFADTLRFLLDNKDYIYAINSGPFGLDAGSPISKSPLNFGIVKTWEHAKTPLGSHLAYKTSSGVSMEEAWNNWRKAVPLFRSFHPHSNLAAYYRDHALLIYKRLGSMLRPEQRRFPTLDDVLPDALTRKTPAPAAVSHTV
jgi:hypothetical protein